MAIIVNASGEYLQRTANLPPDNGFTAMCWVYLTSIRSGQYQYLISIENATSSSTAYKLLGFDNSGNLEIVDTDGGTDFASDPTAGAWYHMYLRHDGTTFSGGWRAAAGTVYVTASKTTGSNIAEAALTLGSDSYNEYCDVRLAGIKIWDAHLTDAEIEREWMSLTPVRTGNLNIWTPGVLTGTDRVKDWGPNVRNWTAGGTLTDGDGPPVPWGASPILVGKAAATGPATITGTGALTSDAATIAGTAERTHTGTGALTSQGPSIAGTAERTVKGTGALTAQAPTIAGTAERVVKGTGALSAEASSIAGTAERTLTAAGALASQAATISGTSERSVTGTGALTSAAATIAGVGGVGDVIVGSGALAAQDATVEGTAERTLTGTGALTSQAATVAGTAEREITATGALSSQASSVAGTAEREGTGTGALTSAAATISGDGLVVTSGTVAGTGALAANDATIAGDGTVIALPRSNAAGGKKRRRSRYIKLPEDLEREEQERQAQEREEQAQQAKPQPKRAKRAGKASRGIQLAPEPDAAEQFRAAEILAQRTAELIAQQQAAQDAMRAEGMAMLQAAAQIEAENEMLMLLLMAA